MSQSVRADAFGKEHQGAAGEVAHHVHEHRGDDLVGRADESADLLERRAR